jgi:hypothetical protein
MRAIALLNGNPRSRLQRDRLDIVGKQTVDGPYEERLAKGRILLCAGDDGGLKLLR